MDLVVEEDDEDEELDGLSVVVDPVDEDPVDELVCVEVALEELDAEFDSVEVCVVVELPPSGSAALARPGSP